MDTRRLSTAGRVTSGSFRLKPLCIFLVPERFQIRLAHTSAAVVLTRSVTGTFFSQSCTKLTPALQSGNFDVKDKPRPSGPVTDKFNAVLDTVKQNQHIGSYDIAEKLGMDHETS
ncbi:hypothetical protein EVAR_37746_1 [Eumeta japonica]|uniref:Uncharacterized protein n=1 Tax=Eumeta variegata TaxID=151549 RepID=A0A4C1WPU9_EUMVA|nr:hypothetical protein EVAR_37746_1 [Eumeta japonica]